ncbi:DUF563 domain-containing protein [Acetobacter musti]|uniref:DUF563 domain-containing protein n=1 Tax=Acetobacter musti TaxID=864732 RepID=A0ABX0JRD8_9PROT|nr:glycosyltransferase family 61 protein [Acetobacter musti]NHN85736.1 DUF563 domain-containing protein [Acetobacter musti]
MKEKALLLKTPYPIGNVIGNTLSLYDVYEISDLSEASRHPEAKVLFSAFVLTHANTINTASDFIQRACKRFPMVIFIEPSEDNQEHLIKLGYKSIHENYQENHLLGKINTAFFKNIGSSCGIYRIDRFGIAPTFSLRAPWIVPLNCSHTLDYEEMIRRDNQPFDEAVFEMSAFAVRGFDAPEAGPEKDLELVDAATIQPHARAGGFFLENFKEPRDLGPQLYQTPSDVTNLLESRKIHYPILLDDGAAADNEYRIKKQDEWRGMFASPWHDLSVNALTDCIIGGSGFIFSGGKPVAKSDYLLPFLCSSIYQPIWEGMQKPHRERHIHGVSVMGFNHLYYNYYHFVAEALNSVSLCLDILSDATIQEVSILTGKLNSFRREYFNILLHGRKNIRIVEIDCDEYVRTDRILYCDNLLGRSTPQPILVAERIKFQKILLDNAALTDVGKTNRMIYVSRQDTAARRILNEPELIERLLQLGFEIFSASEISVYDQIKTFREARLVIGGHGAGISNMLFAREETILLELIQASYLNVGPMRLAQIAGCHYYSMLFFEDGENNGWYIDIDRVVQAASQWL